MAQAFITTYNTNYKWKVQPKVGMIGPDKTVTLDLDDDAIWLVNQNAQLNEEIHNMTKIKETIRNLKLKRWRSTYRVSFCENLKFSIDTVDGKQLELKSRDEDIENELLVYGRNLYEKAGAKIMPPLKTSRNLYGYIRPSRLRTKLTGYQSDYGKMGYKFLKSAYPNS